MYVDSDYYFNTYNGTKLSTENVDKYLKVASRQVDTLTFNRITFIGTDNLTEFQLNIIQETVCELADFYVVNEEQINSGLSNYSINGVSMTFGDGNSVKFIDGIYIPTELYKYLSQTGLCCRVLF